MIQLRRVLFPSDFSAVSLHALTYARSLAESYQAELHVLHVVDDAFQYWMTLGPNSLPIGPKPDEMLDACRKSMDNFVQQNLADAKTKLITSVALGRPFLEILQYAKDHDVDLIVMGTHGRGALAHVLLGSVTEKVVRKAPCPVLTVRHPEHEFVMP